MRLDRFVSQAIGLTRREAQRTIRNGGVQVDGAMVKDVGLHVTPTARVQYRGERVALPRPRYLMLNKPTGYVCATGDKEHRTVIALLDPPNPAKLRIAGRLDIDATGLVLLTDDGEWSHRVMSPRHRTPKTYRVTLTEPLDERNTKLLSQGVQLKNEPRRCRPAEIEWISDTELRITITEGKYHQVKRMFAALGNNVVALHRERIGAVSLDTRLAAGESRPLTEEEVKSFDNNGN